MSYATEVLADTPLVYWKLDEASGNFTDSSGNGRTATAYGNPYTYQQSPGITTGYSIFNSDSDASTGSHAGYTGSSIASLFSNPDVWTVEAWIKTSAAQLAGIIELGANSIQFRVSDSPAGYLQLVKSFTANDGVSTISVADGLWHHVVGRRTGGVSTLWIDGADRSGTMANPTYAANTNVSGFGAAWSATPTSAFPGSCFVGNLDEIAIYNSALSGARILAHYQAGIAQVLQIPVARHALGAGRW